jgi:type II secretory pathway pseudopilin PulG
VAEIEGRAEERSMQRRLVLCFVLLIVGFLAGFVLQYARLQQAQQELSASTKQLGSCQAGEQLSQLRDTATAMFLQAVQKNYGKAGEDSKEFFDQAQRIQSSTGDPALRNLLHDILATRDQITADLAKGDAAALSEVQALLSKIEQTAKH